MADQEEDQGITAYHGSPHEFDQFDLSKIGTGEGAQAYGHGLYFAESEPVAKGYAKEIAKQQHVTPSMQFDGGYIHQGQDLKDLTPSQIAAHVVADNGVDTAHKLMSEWSQDYYSGPMWKAALEALQENPEKFTNAKWRHGHMYEVSINAHPDHFLDWDKSFDDQSPYVKKALTKLVASGELRPAIMNLKGENIHAHIMNKFDVVPEMHGFPAMKGDPEQASKFLSDHGIHGIKYLDAGSRGDKENPTRNYVVFDDKLVNVKRRYEQGGRVGFYEGGIASKEEWDADQERHDRIQRDAAWAEVIGNSVNWLRDKLSAHNPEPPPQQAEQPQAQEPAPTATAPSKTYWHPEEMRKIGQPELDMYNEMMKDRYQDATGNINDATFWNTPQSAQTEQRQVRPQERAPQTGGMFAPPKDTTTFGSGIRDVGFPPPAHEPTPLQRAIADRPQYVAPQRASVAQTSDVGEKKHATVRESFDQAFGNARKAGLKTFTWVNPKTGEKGTYGTVLGRKEGGRVPSLKNPDEWLASTMEIRPTRSISSARKPSKVNGTAIVNRAVMLSSKKS